MRCPKCEAEQGDAAAVAARGYHCLACDARPKSSWWHRAELSYGVRVREKFGEFHVRGEIETTSACVCFDAVHVASGRVVDLRVCREWVASPERVALFERLLAVTGPSCVPPFRSGRDGDCLYVATERVGRPISEWLGTTRVEWQRASLIMIELCRAVSVAHSAELFTGFVPERVFMTANLDVRVDLFAHFADQAIPNPDIDRRAVREMRLDYHSPERLMGKPLDARSDVYTLGVIAYEMLIGQRPFEKAVGPAGLISAMLRERPPTPRSLVWTVPEAIDAAIMRCLEKDRNARFANVHEVADAFRDDDVS